MMNRKFTIKNVLKLSFVLNFHLVFSIVSIGQAPPPFIYVSGASPCMNWQGEFIDVNGAYPYFGFLGGVHSYYIQNSQDNKQIHRVGDWRLQDHGNGWMFRNDDLSTLPLPPLTGWFPDPAGDCPNATPPTLSFSPFPVKLSSFKGVNKVDGVELLWTTQSEVDNKGFSIEHSMDGREWQEIAFIDGNGTSSEKIEYSYSHANTKSGPHYYRLVQRDYDDMYEYSKVIRVMVVAKDDVVIYPNPAHDILYLRGLKQEVNYSVYNFTGVLVQSGLTEETINILDLESGIYIIEILEHNKSVKCRFVKY